MSSKLTTRGDSKKAIYVYLKLTLIFSAVFWILVIWSGHLNMGFGLVIPLLMWCPAAAAWVTCRLLRRPFGEIAWKWPKGRYIFSAYAIPLAYSSIAYGVVWATRLAGWNSEFVGFATQELGLIGLPRWGAFVLYVALISTAGIIENLSTTLGEEIGWRGFLVPELARHMSFTRVAVVSGLIWAVWHSPLVLFADYNASTGRWYSLVCSSITCISVSFMLAWFRLKSESIWPAALLHASHNLFIPVVFDNLTRNTGPTLWYTTEFGVAVAVTTAVFAVYFWSRHNEVGVTEAANSRTGFGPTRATQLTQRRVCRNATRCA